MKECETDKDDLLVYLGLGSNIEPSKNIIDALIKLDSNFLLFDISHVYESPSSEGSGPNFLNCIAAIKTELPLELLKSKLRRIEARMGRVRTTDKNAPRPIDIDILIYAGHVLDEELWKQPYLTIPLAEVCPDLINLETGRNLQEIADDLNVKCEIIRRDDLIGNREQLQTRSA